eukprot:15445266-Alexandrium_andersonii.AAC.1
MAQLHASIPKHSEFIEIMLNNKNRVRFHTILKSQYCDNKGFHVFGVRRCRLAHVSIALEPSASLGRRGTRLVSPSPAVARTRMTQTR